LASEAQNPGKRQARGRAFGWKTLDPGSHDLVLFLSLAAITALSYFNTLSFEFVYDDEILIVNNPLILSARSIPSYFTQHLVQFLDPHAAGNYYRPVSLLWLLLNRTLWGTDPTGWHLLVVVLHALDAGCVYLLARKILRQNSAAWLAGAVFALHPVHVESVAWAAGFTDPLFTLLVLASFLCYLQARECPGRRVWWGLASFLAYALAAFAKEPALTLPLLVFAHAAISVPPAGTSSDTRSLSARLRGGLGSAAPYLAVTAVYLAARVAVLGALSYDMTPLPLGTVLATLPRVLWSYLKLLLWPVGLSAFYDVPYVRPSQVSLVLLPMAGVSVAAVGLWLWSRSSRAAAVATSWLVLPLLVLLNLRAFQEDEIVHDRYLYLASVGFALLLGLAWQSLGSARSRLPARGVIRVVVAVLLVATLGAGTIHYSRFWADNQALYERGIAIAPNNNLATNNLAGLYVARGEYAAAIPLYESVIARKKDFWLSIFNLGFCFYKLGRLQEAERYLRRAIAVDATLPDSSLYLGLVCLKTARVEEAERQFRRALALRPDGRGYHFALGMALKLQGAWAEARREFQLELVNYPGEAAARQQLTEIDTRFDSPQSESWLKQNQ
jgi:tetratricopeptide (TPR) repeat protein